MQSSESTERGSLWIPSICDESGAAPSCDSLYEDLERAIRGAISRSGNGWARKCPRIASNLQEAFVHLLHWSSDIRNTTNRTLEKIEIEDAIIAKIIRNHLGFARIYVRELQNLCIKTAVENTDKIEVAFELLKSIQISIKGLQQQVDIVRAIVDPAEEIWTRTTLLSTDSDFPSGNLSAAFGPTHSTTSTYGLSMEQPMKGREPRQVHLEEVQQSSKQPIRTSLKELLLNSEKSVRDLFEVFRQENFEDKVFYSAESWSIMMTKQRTQRFLQREYPKMELPTFNKLVETVTTRFVKVLSILLILGEGQWIVKFVENGLDDRKLPLDDHLDGLQSDSPDKLDTLSFIDKQWRFLTPVLDYRRFECLSLDERVPLPWLKVKDRTDEVTRHGPEGTAKRFRINAESHNLDSITNDFIAVKTRRILRKPVWDSEMQKLSGLHKMRNPHLMRSYGVIEQGDKLHFIYPWAECNLRDYWESHPGPLSSLTHSSVGNKPSEIFAAWDEIIWLSDQISGIVKGLAAIHDQRFLSHGAMKPENILMLRPKPELRGKFVITDFGARKFHTNQNIGDARIANLMSMAYSSPESAKDITKRSDVWSLGCIILEFVCWILEGYNNNSFTTARDEPDFNGFTSLMFFHLEVQGNEDIATIKPAVTNVRKEIRGLYCSVTDPSMHKCFHRLRMNRLCPGFVHDLLNYVQNSMLLVQPDKRALVRNISSRLDEMHAKVIASKTYATGWSPECLTEPLDQASPIGSVSGTQAERIVDFPTTPSDSDSSDTASNHSTSL